jgi:hypothetical protein
MDTNLTGEHVASIFRIEVCMMGIQLGWRESGHSGHGKGSGDTTRTVPIGAMNQFDPEDEGSMFLRNIGIHLQD